MRERRFDVLLNNRRVGLLRLVEDVTRFALDAEYAADPERAVLGLRFEQDRHAAHRANLRVPPWFSNLLPEGVLRDWIAQQRGVAVVREMELLAEVGADLPGAVAILPSDTQDEILTKREVSPKRPKTVSAQAQWRFSLAGVQLKFSMLRRGERFTAPGTSEDGDWIVKLPDAKFPNVPKNEFATMALARAIGLDVPETRLVHREEVEAVPDRVWPDGEDYAYAVRRFDRGPDGARIHMEDLAQVRGFYPEDKYRGSFETVASLIYRRRDLNSLREFVKRLAFNVIVRNADAHLKNWSLLYSDPRVPTLSPAYDLVSTAVYPRVDRDLGLKLGGSRRFEDVTLNTFGALQARLQVSAQDTSFETEVSDLAVRALASVPEAEELLSDTGFANDIREIVTVNATRLRKR